jgi:tripartite-type tricarboxylate transporter receptor subunit TctC
MRAPTPGKLAYGSAGPGSSVHMVTALFEMMSGAQREPTLPGVPTVAESGVPGYAATSWWTVAAPRGTPAALTEKIQQDLRRTLSTPAAQARLDALGVRLVANTPAEAAAQFASETVKWSRVIEAAQMHLD